MAFTEALKLIVDADVKGAVQGIEKLGKTADRELSKSEQRLDQWGNRLTKTGAGMIAFGGAALVGLGAMARASEEANLAQLKLQNTIDNAPKLAGESADQFIDLAESIQKVTAADADQIVEAEAMLGTFQLTANEIKKITPLVVDYARKFGIDLVDAATQVGKALDGQSGALKRNGVSIDETLFATDRYAAVQKALSEQVGGFAEAEGKTFAGSLERMKNELGDLAEGVGGGAVDAFTTLFGAVEKVANALEGISPGAQSAIGQFATFGSVGLIAAGGISVLIGQVIKARQNFADLASGVASLGQKLGGLKGAAQIAGLATSIIAVAGAIETYNNAQQQMNVEKGANAFLAAGESAAKMREVLRDLSHQGVAEVVGTFSQLAETNREAAERFIATAEAAGFSDRVIRDMRDHLATLSGAEQQTTADTDAVAGAMDGAAESTEDATTKLQGYIDLLSGLTDPVFAAADALNGVRDAQIAVRDAGAEVFTATVALNDALASGDQEAIAEATRDLEDAQRNLSDAQWATVESAAQADSALAGLQDAVRNGDVSVAQFKTTLGQWVAQGFLTQEQADAAATAVGGLADQAAIADQQRVDIPITAQDEASGVIRYIQERVDALTGKTIYINAVASYPVPDYQTFGGRQAGGGVVPSYFQSGGLNWDWGKGPRGSDTVPAWLTPGEMILNQRQQSNLFRLLDTPIMTNGGMGSGGVLEVHSHVYLDGREVVESVRKIVQADHGGNVQNALGYKR